MVRCDHLLVRLYIIYSCIFTGFQLSVAIKWLSGLYFASLQPNSSCDSIKGLNKKQISICRRDFEFMGAVLHGARLAVHECQSLLADRRWNCSGLVDESDLTESQKRFPREATPESAFVHALVSASISNSVTQACSRGDILSCGCEKSDDGSTQGSDFHWAGCSDNVYFGLAFSRTFIDARDLRVIRSKKSPLSMAKAMVNLHNSQTGRKIISDDIKVQCKCHGVSGSCDLKTCWKRQPPIKETGSKLKARLDSAYAVNIDDLMIGASTNRFRTNQQTYISDWKIRRLSKVNEEKLNNYSKAAGSLELPDHQLIYIYPSPNFCEPIDKFHFTGTKGRICNRFISNSTGSCDRLCCGRGYTTKWVQKSDSCNCKFIWCCQVHCERCLKNEEINICS